MESEPDISQPTDVSEEDTTEQAEDQQSPEVKGRHWLSRTKEGLKTFLASAFSTKAEMTNRFWNATTKINGLFMAGIITKVMFDPEVQRDVKIAASSFILLGLATFGVATYDSYTVRQKDIERKENDGTR